ncbi:Gfo/Idh/MocA family oxidoreductase [Paenibacillus sp. BR1-192]|uniref:Gfo/Idh/MocA family protein n=1 Tax=Paenibacillus sp. BR1-192 TaxID=3032287 RepID=UPI00240D6531|nr:Gfo/Idh/MocA family oxidoreductase [Paenibacillus sp. BR1-192]WFB56629.1 Gfo/Idh/MocA family oxidoreductase [Paenibacillus sp. BR1-192]
MLHVLVVGAGAMGKTHAAAYASMPGVKLAGIADIRLEKARQLADEYEAGAYRSFEAAVEDLGAGQIDVIDVCLPTPLHKDYVVKAADIGKHVICEKPLARTEEDARFMINYCRDKGVRLFVGHVLRFFPEYVKAKSLLDQGSIGKPAVIRAGRGGGYPIGWNHWYSDFGASGGITLDAMIHDFDYLRWCFGEVERVYAKGLNGRLQAQLDYSLVTLRFRSGVIAHVEGTWAHDGFSMNLEMAGTSGIIDYDSAKDSPLLFKSRSSAATIPGVAVPESPLERSPYYRELEHFMSCIRDGSEPLVSAEDAYEALRIALAALASMAAGEPVVVGDAALTLAST